MNKPNLKILSKKFPEQDIEWRVQQCGQGNGRPWALIIPYITNRAIMSRLDDAVGLGGWKNEFKLSPCGTGYLCGISIKIDDEWIGRWDGAEKLGSTNIDGVKSTVSSSMKRTGVQWGIGRYLYHFEAMFADVKVCDNRYNLLPGYHYQNSKDKKTNSYFGFQWKAKPLESWALPVTDKEISNYLKAMKEAKTKEELKIIYGGAYKLATSEGDSKLLDVFVKSKDENKQRLINIDNEEKYKNQEMIDVTIRNSLNLIDIAKNKASVISLTGVAVDEIKTKAKGADLKTAINAIQSHSANKLKTLRG